MNSIKLILFFTFITLGFLSRAQSDTLYHIEIHAAGSPVITFFEDERYPGAPDNAAYGYGFSLRLMWHPGRLLALGLMSGYLFIVKDEITMNSDLTESQDHKASAYLNAIPLQVVVSMQKNGIELGLGMGPYLLLSTIELGRTAKGRRYELGLTFFGSYIFPISEQVFIGPELRVLYLSYRGIFSFMPSITLRINPWSY
jgi:hypothetical protein